MMKTLCFLDVSMRVADMGLKLIPKSSNSHFSFSRCLQGSRYFMVVGIVRKILPQPLQPDNCVGRLGPHGQGLEPDQLPPKDQPFGPHRLPEHRNGIT